MKKLFCIGALLLAVAAAFAQTDRPDDYRTTVIDKDVREFPLKIDLSTPFDSYLSREYLMWSGKERLWDSISTKAFYGDFGPVPPDRVVPAERKERVLNGRIVEMIVYRDSAAAVITHDPSNGYYYMSSSRREGGRWVNAGQNMARSLDAARERVRQDLEVFVPRIRRIEQVMRMPQDKAPFLDYLRRNGQAPKDFILGALDTNRIVVYGEYHRRRVSWDLLRSVIADPRFAQTTGIVFMELPSRMQPALDSFFRKPALDPEILYRIYREEQPHGWWDKGGFEFLKAMWTLNRSLPAAKKISVVLADFQIPYSEIANREQFENCPEEDRNTHMAGVVERTVRASKDKRNNLFVVGCGHAYKSEVPGGYSTPRGERPVLTAGAQLNARFPGDVFAIFQHVVSSDNSGGNLRLIRGGMFDRVFEEAGNAPVAFRLKGGPFGAEPFDGGYDEAFDPRAGRYEDNFDGYLFMQPLADEMNGDVLYEIFSDSFVDEIKRRAAYMGVPDDRPHWFGIKTGDLTAERIKEVLRDESEGKKRFPFLSEPGK